MFKTKRNVKGLVIKTSFVVGLASAATFVADSSAYANVDMSKVVEEDKAAEVQQADQSASENAVAQEETQAVSSSTLKQGQTGQAVKDLQSKLVDHGYSTNGVDGIFGAGTESAVRSFQADNGLAVDGLAGRQTISALGGEVTASAPASSNTASASSSNESVTTAASESTTTETASASEDNSVPVETQVAGTQVSSSYGSVIAAAESQIGAPYLWGGTTPVGFDCSGFINYAFKQEGISLPRTAQGIHDSSAKKSKSDLQAGDLVFFTNTYSGAPTVSHAGIYVGGNLFMLAAAAFKKAT
ncbi:NlpC/P60 family protein [Shouchella plakortidis]|uniref:NlpC/P60 family protein n=1 Tax=Alkalicoccobacillus plakortidis TaxID=444060 RepID=A0ABT0XF59_9BACI|nr:NlpC/P60 family protein [Alkalicoccobacillus plakortidis]MCM2674522.1 NlpC/P60 family protein [Alkalicoccobacillus plakortidis]